MRLWTVQPAIVWEQLQRHGRLRVDEARLGSGGYVPGAYRWLREQLTRRLPGYPAGLPRWAYCAKPDLRWVRHYRPAGQREVRLELEPAPGTFLTFPCWAWNEVYGGNYRALGRDERDAWMRAMREAVPDEDLWPLPEPWRTELEASWQRLFNPALPSRAWDEECPFFNTRSGSREGVLGLLRLEEVRAVTPFVGAGRRGPGE
jgi:hypothetical protein